MQIDPMFLLQVVHVLHTIAILVYPILKHTTQWTDKAYLLYMTLLSVHWIALNGCILTIMKHKLANPNIDIRTIESNRTPIDLSWRMASVGFVMTAYIIVWLRVDDWPIKYVLFIIMLTCTMYTFEKRWCQYKKAVDRMQHR